MAEGARRGGVGIGVHLSEPVDGNPKVSEINQRLGSFRSFGPLLALAMLVACREEPQAQSAKVVELAQPLPAVWIEDSSNDPASASAKKALLAEPKIKGVLIATNGQERSWRVAVDDDGTDRRGYAMYVCLILLDHEVQKINEVRVIPTSGLKDIRSGRLTLGTFPCGARPKYR